MPQPDNTFVHGVIAGILVTAGITSLFASIIFILLSRWANHVNNSLKEIFDRFREENKQKDDRWRDYRQSHDKHTEEIAELKGRMDAAKIK